MDAFLTHQQIVDSYKDYLKSFLSIRDKRIKKEVDKALNDKGFIPEPLIQFKPDFARAASFDHLIANNTSIQNFYQQVDGIKSDLRQDLQRIEKGHSTRFTIGYILVGIVIIIQIIHFFI